MRLPHSGCERPAVSALAPIVGQNQAREDVRPVHGGGQLAAEVSEQVLHGNEGGMEACGEGVEFREGQRQDGGVGKAERRVVREPR